ncbi:MAG: MFS transporter [Candidatus Rokubacteria bacterium]|nr:MFS transporter [Candidatus Rokubacteria bacterium]
MRVAGAVVLLAILVPATSLFIIATALPTVVADIGGLALYAWATIAYSVASIVGSAASSAAARRFGLRGGLAVASALFVTGSLACALAPTMAVIVAGRAVQGLGGGMIIGVVHATVRVVFPAHLWPRMLATISVAWGVAALTGPLIGGMLAQRGLWRATFWLMLPLVALVALLAWRLLPPRRPGTGRERAPLGRLLLICAAVLSLALVANTPGARGRALLFTVTAVAITAAFALDARAPARLFPSGLLSLRRPLGKAFLMIFLVAMATSPFAIYMALFVQAVHAATPTVAGYVFAAHSLAWTAAAIVTTRLPAAHVRMALIGGPVLMVLGFIGLALTLGRGPVAALAVAIVIEGIGIGTCWAHMGNVVLGAARADEEEATAALIPNTQLFAVAFGGALCGIVASAIGLTHEASPAVAAATGRALFGGSAAAALAAAVLALRLRPA